MVSNIPILQPTSTINAVVEVTFEIDNVALEPQESLRLTLVAANPNSGSQSANEFLISTIDLTIIDSECLLVSILHVLSAVVFLSSLQ